MTETETDSPTDVQDAGPEPAGPKPTWTCPTLKEMTIQRLNALAKELQSTARSA